MNFYVPAVLAALAAGSAVAQDSGRITVTGQGEVAATPDMATISMGVASQAATAEEAMDATSSSVAALLETLSAAGIEARDVQTSGLNLNPVWDHGSSRPGAPEVTGFNAVNTVTVRKRGLDGLGEVLDDVLGVGANMFQGLSFGLQDPEPHLDEARRQAVADARRKAELYAMAAGVELGPIISISEATAMQSPQPMFARQTMQAESVPIAEGETTVTAEVTIVWEIKE